MNENTAKVVIEIIDVVKYAIPAVLTGVITWFSTYYTTNKNHEKERELLILKLHDDEQKYIQQMKDTQSDKLRNERKEIYNEAYAVISKAWRESGILISEDYYIEVCNLHDRLSLVASIELENAYAEFEKYTLQCINSSHLSGFTFDTLSKTDIHLNKIKECIRKDLDIE